MKYDKPARKPRNFDLLLKILLYFSLILPFAATAWELFRFSNQYFWAPIVLVIISVIFFVVMFMATRVPLRQAPAPQEETNLTAARSGPAISNEREKMRSEPGERPQQSKPKRRDRR